MVMAVTVGMIACTNNKTSETTDPAATTETTVVAEVAVEEKTGLLAEGEEPESYDYSINIKINPDITLFAKKDENGVDKVYAWRFDNEDARTAY